MARTGTGLSSRAIRGMYQQRLIEEAQAGWAMKIASEYPSDQESEEYKWLGAPPVPRLWVGERKARGLRESGITIVNRPWEASLEIATIDIERDKTGQIRSRIADHTNRFMRQPERLLSGALLNGELTTSTVRVGQDLINFGAAYDGKAFFASDHEEGSSGAQSNLLTASDCPALQVSVATNPTPIEFARAALQVIGHIRGLKDDAGEPFNEGASRFLIMVGTEELWAAANGVATDATLYGASNSVLPNPLRSAGVGIEDVLQNVRLAEWTASFAIFRTDASVKPFIYQVEKAPQLQVLAEGSEREILTGNQLYTLDGRFMIGYGLWQLAAKATFST